MRYLANTTERFTMSESLLSSSCSALNQHESKYVVWTLTTKESFFHYRFCRDGSYAVDDVYEIQDQRDRVKRQGGILPITLL